DQPRRRARRSGCAADADLGRGLGDDLRRLAWRQIDGVRRAIVEYAAALAYIAPGVAARLDRDLAAQDHDARFGIGQRDAHRFGRGEPVRSEADVAPAGRLRCDAHDVAPVAAALDQQGFT